MALYGHELNEDTTPYEAGLGRVVKLEKGEFAGQEALQELSQSRHRLGDSWVFSLRGKESLGRDMEYSTTAHASGS